VAGKKSGYKRRIAGGGTSRLPVLSARRTRSTLLHAEDHRQLIDAVGVSPLATVVSNPRLPVCRASAVGKEFTMGALNEITLLLLIVGDLNWGLVGLFDFDLVAAIFGEMSVISRIVYVLVRISALAQILPLVKGDQR